MAKRKENPKNTETPFKWISEVPELKKRWATLFPSTESWMKTHCSASTGKGTIKFQPLKLFSKGCLQIYLDCRKKDFESAKSTLDRLSDLLGKERNIVNLISRNYDVEGFKYLLRAMRWSIIFCAKENEDLGDGKNCKNSKTPKCPKPPPTFSKLELYAQSTVHGVQLMFYKEAHFPLEKQKELALKLLESMSLTRNAEVVHQYIRILRRIRHQEGVELLDPTFGPTSSEEMTLIEKAMEIDPSNFRIRTTFYELLYDCIRLKIETVWQPFTVGEYRFKYPEEIVRFLHEEIWRLNSQTYSVRLMTLASKFNICKQYRELYPDRFIQYGYGYVNQALEINPNSASANLFMGERLFAQEKLEKAISHFKKAMETSPLSPEYTLVYIRSLICFYRSLKNRITSEVVVDEHVVEIENLIKTKIKLGKKLNWSEWDVQHLYFLNGLLLWIDGDQEEAFFRWYAAYEKSSSIESQFIYISPEGLKRLMLPQIRYVPKKEPQLDMEHLAITPEVETLTVVSVESILRYFKAGNLKNSYSKTAVNIAKRFSQVIKYHMNKGTVEGFINRPGPSKSKAKCEAVVTGSETTEKPKASERKQKKGKNKNKPREIYKEKVVLIFDD